MALDQLAVQVVGLGKIGLPLALQFASSGIAVMGVDNNSSVVESCNQGKSPFFEPSLQERLSAAVSEHLFTASLPGSSTEFKATHYIVVVPLYVEASGDSNFANIDSAVEQVGKSMTIGSTVIFETTLPIGTTRRRFTPLLEKVSGMEAGKDFFVAFSPERVSSGRVFSDFATYPKLVGGIDRESEEKAAELYEKAFTFAVRSDLHRPNGVWKMGSSEAAEFAKLAETTYRDVNIALANTFAAHTENLGLSYEAIREACNSQPFSQLHSPGIYVGGHCIPVYPRMYLQSDPAAEVVAVARRLNSSVPQRLMSKLSDYLGGLNGKRVLVSGLSYRTGVKEKAFSGGEAAAKLLTESGASVTMVDELFSQKELESLGYEGELGAQFDALVINSGTKSFNFGLLAHLSQEAMVVDGRCVLDKNDWPNLIQVGEG